MQTIAAKCDLLAGEIRKIFLEGIHVDPETIRFINATFSDPSADEIAALFKDGETDCEAGPLMELMFYPDESFRLRLEPFLIRSAIPDTAEEILREKLFSPALEGLFHFGQGPEAIKMSLPPESEMSFIRRLHIGFSPDERLFSVMRKSLSSQDRLLALVRMRARPFPMFENTVRFLSDFIEKSDPDSPLFFRHLDFILGIVSEAGPETDYSFFLIQRKKKALENLEKDARYKKIQGGICPEIQMARGVRPPFADRERLMETVVFADEILLRVFGMYEEIDAPVQTTSFKKRK